MVIIFANGENDDDQFICKCQYPHRTEFRVEDETEIKLLSVGKASTLLLNWLKFTKLSMILCSHL